MVTRRGFLASCAAACLTRLFGVPRLNLEEDFQPFTSQYVNSYRDDGEDLLMLLSKFSPFDLPITSILNNP